jgi:hypothetical protein
VGVTALRELSVLGLVVAVGAGALQWALLMLCLGKCFRLPRARKAEHPVLGQPLQQQAGQMQPWRLAVQAALGRLEDCVAGLLFQVEQVGWGEPAQPPLLAAAVAVLDQFMARAVLAVPGLGPTIPV